MVKKFDLSDVTVKIVLISGSTELDSLAHLSNAIVASLKEELQGSEVSVTGIEFSKRSTSEKSIRSHKQELYIS